jgi:hypothetical protein
MAKWTKVGSVRKAKSGKGSYVYFDSDLTVKKGSMLQLQDPRVKLTESLAAGRLDEKRAEEIRSKIPEYITREVFLVEE